MSLQGQQGQGQQFSSRGRPLNPAGPSKNQIAAEQLASMASARAARKELMKEQLIPQLQQNPQLIQQIHTVLQDQQDLDILNELFREISMGSASSTGSMDTGSSGGKKRRRTKRRRTLRRRTLRRRRY